MNPRIGRPKVDEPKDIRFSIRIDNDTNEKLDAYCEKHKITKAEAIRQGIHLLLEQKQQSVAPLPTNTTLYTRGTSSKNIIAFREVPYNQKMKVRKIEMQNLKVIEYKGIRVLTSKQIAEAYGTTSDIIGYNYRYNKERYIEGKHYIMLFGQALREFKSTNVEIQRSLPKISKLYLWTEKGALLHAKSLNTDKAWKVYDYLVDFYFRVKEGEKLPVVRETKSVSIEKQDAKETFDIAPYFISVVEKVPIEALDAMEKSFRKSNSKAIKLATLSILAEKMKRNIE